MRKNVILLAIIFFFTPVVIRCSSNLEDPETINSDEILKLITDRTSIKSNSTETINVYGRILKDAGSLDITFYTTAGKFTYTKDKLVKQAADSISGNYRFAHVVLSPDTSFGSVYISAEITQGRRHLLINFNK